MTAGQRAGLAIVFVTAVGVALAVPVIEADDTEPAGFAQPDESPTEEPDEEPSPSPSPSEEPAPIPTAAPGPPEELAGDYPDDCLGAQSLPSPGAVVAIDTIGTVSLVPVDGGGITTLGSRGGPPPGFSPSGNYIAVGSGEVVSLDDRAPGFDLILGRVWAWSPQSDCVVALSDTGELRAYAPELAAVKLLEGPITSFAIAPSGDRIAVFGDDVLLVYDLRTGGIVGEPAAIPNPSEPLVWSGEDLYFGTPRGEGVAVRGVTVTRDSVNTTSQDYGVILPGSQTACDGRVLAVDVDGQLVDLEAGTPLGDPGFDFGLPSCAPGGSFISVPRRPVGSSASAFLIVALDEDGEFASNIGTGDAGEILPEWGPEGTGIIFLSLSAPRGPADLIYASSSGGTVLPIKVGKPFGFDWSATAPTGIPGTRF